MSTFRENRAAWIQEQIEQVEQEIAELESRSEKGEEYFKLHGLATQRLKTLLNRKRM